MEEQKYFLNECIFIIRTLYKYLIIILLLLSEKRYQIPTEAGIS